MYCIVHSKLSALSVELPGHMLDREAQSTIISIREKRNEIQGSYWLIQHLI